MNSFTSLRVICKNGRINSDDRLSILLSELSMLEWDCICFSETRCKTQDIILTGGHRLICKHDGTSVASGVAILIHSRFVKHT